MSHRVDNEQNSAFFIITEWPCCGIQGHSSSGTAPLLSRSERTHQGCEISSTRTHSPRYKQLTSHLSRFYYNWVPLATSLVTNELRANFHELSSSLWDNTLKEQTLKRSFKNWFDFLNMYFKFYFGFFVSSLFPKSVPGVLESAPHPLKSHDLVRFHRLRYRRISSLFSWLLSYEHTERQRQGPLESIVTLQNRPPPPFPKRQRERHLVAAAAARSVHTLRACLHVPSPCLCPSSLHYVNGDTPYLREWVLYAICPSNGPFPLAQC